MADALSSGRLPFSELIRMRFYEYEAKELFRRHGLPLGKSQLVHNADEARKAFDALGGIPVVLKSQVLSGGRV